MKPKYKPRKRKEYRKCEMCKQYPKTTAAQFYDFTPAMSENITLTICKPCLSRELGEKYLIKEAS